MDFDKNGMAELKGLYEDYGFVQRLALIRFYFQAVPKTTDEFVTLWNQLVFALRFDGKLKITELPQKK